MAARCPLLADHGYLTHTDGSVKLTRSCEDMTPTALTDLKAALTLLGDRAVNLRVPQPRLWTNVCSTMQVWLDRHEGDRGALEGQGIPRLPHWFGGETMAERQARLIGQIHRVTEGS